MYFSYVKSRFIIVCLLCTLNASEASVTEYFKNIGSYFKFYETAENHNDLSNDYNQRIPYEVSVADEKFINEAAKLTGVVLSSLDSCQQRVVLKLQVDCHKINDEQLSKMAVHLLNCQSYAEGRAMYPCTDEMSLKQCTTNMDADTWTSYHLMSNRARAVCYSVRQNQFRGLAEHTVNRLMDAARNQLTTLTKIVDSQASLHSLAESTYDRLAHGHEQLAEQQRDIQRAQFHGQLALEDNINKLTDEKRLIMQTHNQLIEMTKSVKEKLEDAAQQMEDQTGETRNNHRELIEDLVRIQERTHNIFRKIEESSEMLIDQNEVFRSQYEATLRNLAEMNKTVQNLVSMVGATRAVLEERLSWITSALGGTDLAVERLYLIIWHSAFMLLSMLSCAFLSARLSTRLIVATLPPLNLFVSLYSDSQQYFDPLGLIVIILTFVLAQMSILFVVSYQNNKNKQQQTIYSIQDKPVVMTAAASSQLDSSRPSSTIFHDEIRSSKLDDVDDDFVAPTVHVNDDIFDDESDIYNRLVTPPASRSSYYRARTRSNTPLRVNSNSSHRKQGGGTCYARTKLGTPCKLSAIAGRDFCYRHQSGDSIVG